MASEAITLPSPVEAGGGGYVLPPGRQERRISREEFLHRTGSAATLMIVESFETEDGSRRRAVRFAFWPGL